MYHGHRASRGEACRAPGTAGAASPEMGENRSMCVSLEIVVEILVEILVESMGPC